MQFSLNTIHKYCTYWLAHEPAQFPKSMCDSEMSLSPILSGVQPFRIYWRFWIEKYINMSNELFADMLWTLNWQIVTIWKILNPNIWLIDSFQIWPIKSVFFAIQGFDWVLVSHVVLIIRIVMICHQKALIPNGVPWCTTCQQYC